ncbi:NAD(P)/FAD-dependent oxidoreductase [Salegentibacter mishustinae]|uniref:NAD(P)/FAD-dependent oxidoreductase n=1 Tax=Salegentibacter mishustinae TaxID=270918 RepID=UPI001CE15258|nr:NAD(P)/FAD-dependent oxidoreductase [Salegentibacter mishustinae]UBZ06571.1 NAD(P)/FAD-dependent oxidoreductase [Salegentibacter mishustinae]
MADFQVIIVGAGLAGLTAAIHLSQKGKNVLLIEKKAYPRHKVCGEYLSNEVLPYFNSLNIDLEKDLKPVKINNLLYSTQNAKSIEAPLNLGGLGLSRHALDHYLFNRAEESGAKTMLDSVENINFKDDEFNLRLSSGKELTASLVLGAFGKRSNLDKSFQRDFIQEKSSWLAIKGHYKLPDFPENLVALHNFKGGYCGLSKTEAGVVNACYMVSYKSFKKYKNTDEFKEKVLLQNAYLKGFFKNAKPLFKKDLSIAQISFQEKSSIKDRILMLGDAAGLIHPLCGNGMAMAIHSGKIASEAILNNFKGKHIDRKNLEKEYRENWNANFSKRLKTGRMLQTILINPILASTSQNLVKKFPYFLGKIISKTHGKPII